MLELALFEKRGQPTLTSGATVAFVEPRFNIPIIDKLVLHQYGSAIGAGRRLTGIGRCRATAKKCGQGK